MVAKDDAAIKQAVVNLIMTIPGERPFNNKLGSSLNALLFEPLDFAVASQIESEIRLVLRQFEPRIIVTDLQVEPNLLLNGLSPGIVMIRLTTACLIAASSLATIKSPVTGCGLKDTFKSLKDC